MIFVAACPFARKMRIRHRTVQPAHGLLHIVLHLARALGDGFGNMRCRIHQNVLKMCEHSRIDILEALAWFS